MAQETFTRESFFAELDELGEERVRTRVVTRAYTSVNKKLELAQEWLRLRDQARNEASQTEQTDIARSAKDAAWAAAEAARDAANEARLANTHAKMANRIATIALVASAIAIAVSIVGLFLRGS